MRQLTTGDVRQCAVSKHDPRWCLCGTRGSWREDAALEDGWRGLTLDSTSISQHARALLLRFREPVGGMTTASRYHRDLSYSTTDGRPTALLPEFTAKTLAERQGED